MLSIFTDMVKEFMKVFMDDFFIVGDWFEQCVIYLKRILQQYVKMNLVFNWEKCHFMIKESIVLVHKILADGLQVDQTKIKVIAKLPLLFLLKE